MGLGSMHAIVTKTSVTLKNFTVLTSYFMHMVKLPGFTKIYMSTAISI